MVSFTGKFCLAPMVRSGELPNRLLALKHGADLVWTPEYVDKKIIQTKRIVNDSIDSIDYIVENSHNSSKKKGGKGPAPPTVVFRTVPKLESGKLIFQLGTSDPVLAVEAALKVIGDVDGIDLNCGCPKPFSTHSGMGAALLSTPDLLCSILTNLVEKIGKPNNKTISCKIRLLSDYPSTHSLVEKICATGIANLTIHCRTRDMRNRNHPNWGYLSRLIPFIQSKNVNVIINGNLQSRSDILHLQQAFNDTKIGGMIAECAESNPSVFSETPLTPADLVPQFYEIARKYNYDNYSNTKFMLLNQLPGKSAYYKRFAQLKTFEDSDAIVAELAKETDDKWLNRIYTRDCQKQKSLTEEEYQQHLAQRYEDMKAAIANINDTIEVEQDTKKRASPGEQASVKKAKIVPATTAIST